MKQLVFIHGGETFDTYEEYLTYLRAEEYDPRREHAKRWKNALVEELGEEWEVFAPTMPSKYNAKYLEWSIWFEKILPYLHDEAILVGHSLGGIFLAKYLSEHELPFTPSAVMLVSAPFDTSGTDYTLADFVLPADLSGLEKQAGKLFLYHSEDDDVVPFSAFLKYRELLPSASARVFKDRGHFLGPEFPELLADIRSIA